MIGSPSDVSALIAAAPDRENDFRIRRIRFDAAAQALHQRVDAAFGHECLVRPHPGQQRLAAEHNPGTRREQMEQSEFLRRQVDVLAADTHAAACWIDVQTVNLYRAITRGGSFGLQLRSARTAQQRARPRYQLANAERLRQVIIGPALEAKHFIALLTASREHQDWHVLVGSFAPDRATDRDAVDTREHQVENDEVEGARVGTDERGLAVAHGLGLKTLEAEVEHDQVTNMRIVFDHQYAGHNQSSLS